MMPVLELKSKYIKPARYDDLLFIHTHLTHKPSTRIHFQYEIFNEEQVLLNLGETTLVFVQMDSGRPCGPPESLISALKPYFSD